ncbi:hypothetical protein LRAMOSA04050 [Lichtheimia ramosa]|uniref:B30.2/SPRY domain-containing protein n=1 Tax=Lichtheimia ramosa TaxID=688394 RepID=A0A077WXA1_9FUNG|nr:hypothetical protein LRAMOSA04050 [Lichtheimia ramosa]
MSSPVSPLGPTSLHDLDTTASYSIAFPPLQPIPLSFPQHPKRTQHCHQLPPALQTPLVPPKYPSYLKQTLYADLVLEQYNLRQCRRSSDQQHYHTRPHDLSPECRPPSSSSLSHCVQDIDLRLPTFWNRQAKPRYLEVGRNGLDLSYNGPGKSEQHAAAICANFPMRPQCGVYYYEMHVLSKGNDGYITIGFSTAESHVDRVPGYQGESWGYQGDNGNIYAGSTRGTQYGPGFTTGDIVGCGINFANGTAFYTKNGAFLGVAFNHLDSSAEYYPCIGLRTPGENITVNFGNEPFLYDIDQYIKDQKIKAWEEIGNRTLGTTMTNTNTTTKNTLKQGGCRLKEEKSDDLVLSYLIHQGYMGTAKAMVKDAMHVCDKKLPLLGARDQYTNEKDLQQRSDIRSALTHGNVDRAIQLTEQYYPGVLQHDKNDIMFELKCRKFIEMIHEYSEREKILFHRDELDNDQASITSNNSSITNFHVPNCIDDDNHHPLQRYNNHSFPAIDIPDDTTQPWSRDRRRSTSGSLTTNHATASAIRVPGRRRMSYAAIAASASPNSTSGHFAGLSVSPPPACDEQSLQHEHDDYAHPLFSNRRHRRASTRRSSTCSSLLSVGSLGCYEQDEPDLSQVDEADERGGASAETITMKHIMDYGQKLQAEHRHDDRLKIRTRLVEIFSLLAYPDVNSSPVAHLMAKSGRDELATQLNAAILGNRGMSPLESIYRQVLLTNKELACAGDGQSAIVNVEEYCAQESPHSGNGTVISSES